MLEQTLMNNMFNLALTAAQSAGQFIVESIDRALNVDFKGRANLVTEVDRKAEELIVNMIKANYSDHQILAEESPPVDTPSPFKWIIDPLDGTTNYVHGFPFFAVSIALQYQGALILGVVYNPFFEELFTARSRGGAFLNKRKIRVSNTSDLKQSLLVTGFPYELSDIFYKNMQLFQKFYEKSQGIRRMGSAAIDLCYTACGRFDGFWEYSLNPWDMAAGSLILHEAGGQLSNFSGEEFSVYGQEILASNSHIHADMLAVLEQNN